MSAISGNVTVHCPLVSSAPLQKWKREAREAEERRQQGREALRRTEEAGSREMWDRWIDSRIEAWLARPPAFSQLQTDVLSQAMAEIQSELCQEFQRASTEMQRSFETKLAVLEERLKAVPGRLPITKVWHQESVTYGGEVAFYDGSLYQARKDTAQVPGGSDWVCVARGGRNGSDGRTPNVCGTHDVRKKYERLDIVVCDGVSFIARRDDPGMCPGPGWQPLVSRGKAGDKGPPGPRGEKGESGEPGEIIVGWTIDPPTYRAFPVLSNGQLGPELNLRQLFEQYHSEAR